MIPDKGQLSKGKHYGLPSTLERLCLPSKLWQIMGLNSFTHPLFYTRKDEFYPMGPEA